MKMIIGAVLALLTCLLAVETASAHVLITDTTNMKGAILHIVPDDDPIAGETATLYFDTQDGLLDEAEVFLTINSDDDKTNVPINVSGSLVTADYIFPAQGVYDVVYLIKKADAEYTFEQSQRVTRGVLGSALDEPSYAWAQILGISSGVGLAALAIVAFNRRKEIANQSFMK